MIEENAAAYLRLNRQSIHRLQTQNSKTHHSLTKQKQAEVSCQEAEFHAFVRASTETLGVFVG